MKLTSEQIAVINHYTDGYRIDREKLVAYLEKHKTIKNDVFDYCTKVSKRGFPGARGYCMYLDDAPMFTPIDRETFIRRIPFYFYQMPMANDSRSGLSLVIPVSSKDGPPVTDYAAFYADLEWMFYDLRIPLGTIFDYARDQVAPPPAPQPEKKAGLFNFSLPPSLFKKGGLDGRTLFQQWRHYLHLCDENGWSDIIPDRFITAYNEALVKVGQEPVIYYPVKEYGSGYVKEDHAMTCEGHFPCDKKGTPILEWTSIKVSNPASITFSSEKSQCGKLQINFGPKTVIYVLDENPEEGEDPDWQQIYAGPQTMQFDHTALRDFRKDCGMTQNDVANAIGTSVRTYQKWESGETTPDGHYLIRLMNWLEIEDVQMLVKVVDIPEDEMGGQK